MQIIDFIIKKCNLSENKEKIVRNLFWAVLGKTVTLLGSLFVGIIIARYLGPEQYGLMNYVISYVALFQVFALFGLDNIEIRETAGNLDKYQTIVGTAFGIKLILAIITMVAIIVTSLWLETDSNTIVLISIYSFSVILNTFTVIRNYFTAIVQNEYIVKSEITRTLLGAGIKVLLLLQHASLTWFIIAYTFDWYLLGSGYYVSYKKVVGSISEWKFDRSYAHYLLRESFPLLLTSAAVIIYQRIDQVMIGQMIDKESVGYFSVASRIVEILIFVPMILVQTITPVLVQKRKESESAYKNKAQLFMNVTVWSTFIVALVTSSLAYWAILLLFGNTYLPAVPVLQVMAFKSVSVALSTTAGHMLIVEGIQRFAIFRDAFGCVVCIVMNYLLLRQYGIIAAAFVAIVSNISAGYIADAFIPAYRHLFVTQTKAIVFGWKDMFRFRIITK